MEFTREETKTRQELLAQTAVLRARQESIFNLILALDVPSRVLTFEEKTEYDALCAASDAVCAQIDKLTKRRVLNFLAGFKTLDGSTWEQVLDAQPA